MPLVNQQNLKTVPGTDMSKHWRLAPYRLLVPLLVAVSCLSPVAATELPIGVSDLTAKYCIDCHSRDSSEGNLDLTSLAFDLDSRSNFALWVKLFDRVTQGEMPPRDLLQPSTDERTEFKQSLSKALTAAEQKRVASEGRSTQRRLNRFEYENSVRDLLHAPWLQLKELLPEDGDAYHFNKVSDALDMSHVQMARYLVAADYALDQIIAKQVERPKTTTVRYYAREQDSFVRNIVKYKSEPERIVIPILGYRSQPEIFAKKAPVSVGESDPVQRELEAFVEIASQYESYEMDFDKFKTPMSGRYKLRFKTYTVQVGPTKPEKDERWWIPDLEVVSIGKRTEPVSVYAETPPRQLRLLGKFDTPPEPTVHELDIWLLQGETISPDCCRFYRARQGAGRFRNPNATPEGAPGIALQWMEVEGPILESWPSEGHRLLFEDLPLIKLTSDEGVPSSAGAKAIDVESKVPFADSQRLLKRFMEAACRRPVPESEVQRFLLTLGVNAKPGTTSLSFTASGALIPCENSASEVFRQMFVKGTPAEVASQMQRLDDGQSILDAVADQAKAMQRSVTARDRHRLDQYFSSVRDLEQRMQMSKGWESKPRPVVQESIPVDPASPKEYMDKVKLMYDMARLAFETDSTRCISLMLDGMHSPAIEFGDTKFTDSYHLTSHHGRKESKLKFLKAADEQHMKMLADLYSGLKAVEEDGEPLLDRTMVLYGSNMNSANSHSTTNLPILLAGGGFKHGQHLMFDKDRNYPLPNLFVSMLQRMGIESDRFSTATGTMRGLELS